MKLFIYAFLAFALLLQSCSHIAWYREGEYQNDNPKYSATAMQFAYYANGNRLPVSLVFTGNRILQLAKNDSLYKNYLQSAELFEKENNNIGILYDKCIDYFNEGKNYLQSSKSSDNHNVIIEKITSLYQKSPQYNEEDFSDYWMKIYQLSHRGILQHYMNSDAKCKEMNLKNKSLLYGYLLRSDIPECKLLAMRKVEALNDSIAFLKSKFNKEISHRKTILQEIERRKKEEAERIKRQREAEEREIQERIERKQAQQRRNDVNCHWINGHWKRLWNNVMIHLYIDTQKQNIKVYYRGIWDLSYPKPEYSGPYLIENGTGKYRGYKVLVFGKLALFADPGTGEIYDIDFVPYSKVE